MFGKNSSIPYLGISAQIVPEEHAPEVFIRSLFPDISPDQLAIFVLYCIGVHHSGIELACNMIDGQNLAKEAETYATGYRDGFLKGIE